jgi:hypothetical protein
MVDISLDLNPASGTYKDFLLVDNDLILTSDAQEGGNNPVEQDVLQRISMFLGEWFMDNTQGTPWFQQILVKNPNQSDIDAIFQNIILGTPGVMQLTSYSFTPNLSARTLAIKFSILTPSGAVNYNGILAPVYAGNQSPGVGVP